MLRRLRAWVGVPFRSCRKRVGVADTFLGQTIQIGRHRNGITEDADSFTQVFCHQQQNIGTIAGLREWCRKQRRNQTPEDDTRNSRFFTLVPSRTAA